MIGYRIFTRKKSPSLVSQHDCATSAKPLSQVGLKFSLLYHERVGLNELRVLLPPPPRPEILWFALIGETQWVGCHPAKRKSKIAGSIPVQSTCLGYGFVPS